MLLKPAPVSGQGVAVAGVQLEFKTEAEVLAALDRLIEIQPESELLVLCEYAFDGPIPERTKEWCRQHKRYLVAGGKDLASGSDFYDTAFVVGPDGNIVFRQGKSVPVQFMKDGLPAVSQQLWDSPWGKIGICICYDLSYTRVTDKLIRMGAQALVVPTMDIKNWGKHQHELHARVAQVRAVEYGVPIFRVASSGISQLVNNRGHTDARADFPGESEMLAGRLVPRKPGSLTIDRYLAPTSTAVSCFLLPFLFFKKRRPESVARENSTSESKPA